MNKQYIKGVIDSGGYGEFSNWSFYREGNFYYTDCHCHPRNKFCSFKELWDSMVCDPDLLKNNMGKNVLHEAML